MLSVEDVNNLIDAVILYPRVSSQGQEDGTSLDHQNDVLNDEFSKLDTDKKVKIGDEWESARTMVRQNIDTIIKRVRNTEENYCLMFRSVDRLSRADPLEACVFLWIMKRNDVILYFDDLGYFDLSNLNQVMMLMFQLIQTRDEYLRIIERGEQGRKESKKQGEYPAQAPFGYRKTDDDQLEIVEEEAEAILRAVELYLYGSEEENVPSENVQQAKKQLEDEFSDIDLPTYSTWLHILRRELYTGKLKHDGKIVYDCPQIIPEKKFNKVIERIGTPSDEESSPKDNFELLRVIEQFGVRSSHYLFGDRITFNCPGCGSDAVEIEKQCPECGGEVKEWGSTERWGRKVTNYRCEHHPEFIEEDQDEVNTCDFDNPLFTDKFLREWHDTVPVLCPLCQTPFTDEEWNESRTQIDAVEQVCDCCGQKTTINIDSNKYQRGIDLPNLAIQLFENNNNNSNNVDNNTATNTNNSKNTDNTSLQDFVE